MKIVLLIALAGIAYAMNPAMITSNTYPGSAVAPRSNNQTTFTATRPLYREGMLTPNNYMPYARSAPIMPRDVNSESSSDGEMRILPYPMEYTAQYRNNNANTMEDRSNQGPRPYLGVLPQGMRPIN